MWCTIIIVAVFFFFQAEDGIRDIGVTGVQTCALPIYSGCPGELRATVMLAYIQLLYEIEREARQGNLNPEQRRELRQTKSRPILEDIKNYLQTEKPKVLPKSPIGDAIDYTLSNWEALLRYTEDGELEIDN